MSDPPNLEPVAPSPVAAERRGVGAEPRGVAGWKIVAFVIGGGVLIAGITLGYQMYQSSRVIGFFGSQAIHTIQRADEAIVYVPADAEYAGADAVEQAGLKWRPFAPGENGAAPRNEADRRGWVHVHPAFLASESYFWDEFPAASSLEPDAFVRFRRTAEGDHGAGSAVDVYLDWEAAALYVGGQDRGLRMSESKRNALKNFLLRPAEETKDEETASRR